MVRLSTFLPLAFAALMVAGCGTDDSTSANPTDSTVISLPSSEVPVVVETTVVLVPPPTDPAIVYDATGRTPLQQLPIKLADKLIPVDGERDAEPCIIDAVTGGWKHGTLTPVDVDEYVRNGIASADMQSVLDELAALETCVPGY
jgi:hypothetical protein